MAAHGRHFSKLGGNGDAPRAGIGVNHRTGTDHRPTIGQSFAKTEAWVYIHLCPWTVTHRRLNPCVKLFTWRPLGWREHVCLPASATTPRHGGFRLSAVLLFGAHPEGILLQKQFAVRPLPCALPPLWAGGSWLRPSVVWGKDVAGVTSHVVKASLSHVSCRG